LTTTGMDDKINLNWNNVPFDRTH